MKKSKRLLRNTIVMLNVLMVVYIGANRLYASNDAAQKPGNTSVAELANLRDFSVVEVHGDFKVELVQQAGFSVAFEPLAGTQGTLIARQEGRTLFVYGHGTRGADAETLVKIGMPTLRRVEAHDVPELRLSGFAEPVLSVQFEHTGAVALLNNTVKEWRLTGEGGTVQVDKASLAAGTIKLQGAASIVQLE